MYWNAENGDEDDNNGDESNIDDGKKLRMVKEIENGDGCNNYQLTYYNKTCMVPLMMVMFMRAIAAE